MATRIPITPADRGFIIRGAQSIRDRRLYRYERQIAEFVSRSPLHSLWDFQGVPVRVLITRTWKALFADRIFGHAAELAFYFLFALFPTLFSASSILGLVARSADKIYDRLLAYLAVVIPASALGTVLKTFNDTTAAATPGKLTFGLIAAVWSASVGISAIQDTLNAVYKIEDTRSYVKARIFAIGLTILLTILVTFGLASLLGGNFFGTLATHRIHYRIPAIAVGIAARVIGWTSATALLNLSFATIYYWAPDFRRRCWHWLTPGGAIGILGWLLASLGLRIYLHYFNNYSVTYGSLGAVIILLTWFYLTGLMLLLGAEINSEIEAAAAEIRMATSIAPPASPETAA
ncbi:MAG: YihY/virulence factor BrkB family protein [Terracidiphilus sp.]